MTTTVPTAVPKERRDERERRREHPRRRSATRIVGLVLTASALALPWNADSANMRAARPADPGKAGPHVFYTHGPPHAPNLLVVARAVSLDVAMRAAGLRAPEVHEAVEIAPAAAGARYTEDPLETPTRQTRIDPASQLVPALREVWPQIGEEGARTLAAQFSIETGAGRHCYNYNLGNHKASAKELHMYLRGVWEGIGQDDFDRMKKDPLHGALVREEPAEDVRAKGHVVPRGKLVVILDPPHPGARFGAHPSLLSGVERFARLHKQIGVKNEEYVLALRAGDARRVAALLGSPRVRYFTGNVDAYAQGMVNHRAIIDEGLGPVR